MSRPLLGLILLNEDVTNAKFVVVDFKTCFPVQYFNQLRENIIRAQLPDKQPAMAQWFENLMDGIERNLLTKNRDRLVIYCLKFIFYRF